MRPYIQLSENYWFRLLRVAVYESILFSQQNYYSVFPYKYLLDNSVKLIEPMELKRKYPKALAYFNAKSKYLKTREKGKWEKSPHWYEYSRKQNFESQKMEKILVPGLATYARYTLAGKDVLLIKVVME